jgi:F1F0 ATPase subunit 2
MNPEWWHLSAAFVAGGSVGIFYFGGLWLTVKRVPLGRRPRLLLVGSFVLRLAVLLAAFYALAPWGWAAMVCALAGLLIVRQILIKVKGRPKPIS